MRRREPMPSLEGLKDRTPTLLRRSAARVIHEIGALLVDTGMLLLGQKDPSIPPTRLQFVGSGDFKAVGFEFLRYFTELGELEGDESVLDVGCGIGRMALPLVNFLKRGQYRGFDIVPEGIAWCQKNISAQSPNFQFEFADVHNAMYNPRGRYRASEYRFPYDDEVFDFAFATSVFTHLLKADAAHYLLEIARVLRPGGRFLGTWFLLNEQSRSQLRKSDEALKLIHPQEGEDVMVHRASAPEAAVGLSESLVEAMHADAGLTIDQPIHYGSWCGRSDFLSYQDIVLARKAR